MALEEVAISMKSSARLYINETWLLFQIRHANDIDIGWKKSEMNTLYLMIII